MAPKTRAATRTLRYRRHRMLCSVGVASEGCPVLSADALAWRMHALSRCGCVRSKQLQMPREHMCLCRCTPIQVCADTDVCRCRCVPTQMHTDTDAYRYRCIPMHMYADADVHRYRCIPTQMCTDADVYPHRCVPMQMHTDASIMHWSATNPISE